MAVAAPLHREVLADRLPGVRWRDPAAVLVAAALTGLAAQLRLPLPGTPVPLTGQTFAVLVAGATLGPRRGLAAMLTYVAAGIAGVPWFAGGASGFPGPTGGYLVGFVAAAALVGALAARGADRTVDRAALAMLAGTLVIYAAGIAGLMLSLDVDAATAWRLGVAPFLAGDLLKLCLAALALPAAWRGLQDVPEGPSNSR